MDETNKPEAAPQRPAWMEAQGTTHIVLDLETMGTNPRAPIASIGAVVCWHGEAVNPGETGAAFTVNVDLAGYDHPGMQDRFRFDGSTVSWWLRQSQGARDELRQGADLVHVLQAFVGWLDTVQPDPSARRVWGNGSDFDCVILASAYHAVFGADAAPWPFWASRCLRTLRAAHRDVPRPEFAGTQHRAIDDAMNQAQHLMRIVEAKQLDPNQM